MAAIRVIITDYVDDKESHYKCDCGFNKYLSDTCWCDLCTNYTLPLTHCPQCNTLFTIDDQT